MTIEIERRFILSQADLALLETELKAGTDNKPGTASRQHFRQGYLTCEHPGLPAEFALCQQTSVRVRLLDQEARITVKSRKPVEGSLGLGRVEVELPLPRSEAETLLALCGQQTIEKERITFDRQGTTWEVDVFSGRWQGLVIAECELQHASQVISKPSWLGPEISGEKRLSNAALSAAPETKDTWELIHSLMQPET